MNQIKLASQSIQPSKIVCAPEAGKRDDDQRQEGQILPSHQPGKIRRPMRQIIHSVRAQALIDCHLDKIGPAIQPRDLFFDPLKP